MAICSLIAVAILFLIPGDVQGLPGTPVSFLEGLGFFAAHPITYKYQHGSKLLYTKNSKVYLVDEKKVPIKAKRFTNDQINGATYVSSSPDLSAVLRKQDVIKVFRHSQKARYTVWDRKSRRSRVLDPTGGGQEKKGPRISYAEWGPVRRLMTIVYNGNLYYTNDALGSKLVPITTGLKKLYPTSTFGLNDWLYEEEILYTSHAFWWNNEGTRLAFLGFDDSRVGDYKMQWYGPNTDMYVNITHINYPKAGKVGSQNAKVRVFVYRKVDQSMKFVEYPKGFQKDSYVAFVKWYNEDVLMVAWLDRNQTQSVITMCQTNTPERIITCETLLRLNADDHWIRILKQKYVEPIMDEANKRIFLTINYKMDDDEFLQIASLGLDGSRKAFPTTRAMDIEDILHYSPNEKALFFMSAGTNPTEKHIFHYSMTKRKETCISCNIPGCKYSDGHFSDSGRHFVLACKGPSPNAYYLISVAEALRGRTGVVLVLEDNAALREKLKGKQLPTIQYQSITVRKGQPNQVALQAQVWYPPNFDPSAEGKYPVVLNVYGGPCTQIAVKKYELGWPAYLVTSHDIIYIRADARGTCNRGLKFLKSIYMKMGVVEIQDQIEVIKEFAKNSYVDKNNIGSFGWSYGGFSVSRILGDPANVVGRSTKPVVRCGIAVAPVTYFGYYDTGYTERFLGLISADPMGYEHTKVWNNAKNFKDKDFLLIHGSGDDNVHYQNTMQFIRALVSNLIDFRLMVYPDENHNLAGIHSKNTMPHQYMLMSRFLLQCFNKTQMMFRAPLQ